MASRRSRTAGRRATWGFADQALSSVTNIVISLLAAHVLDADAFGEFAAIYATYILAVGIGRALVGEVVLVRHSTESSREVTEDAIGASLVLGLLGAAVLLLAAAIAGGSLGLALLALAVTLPGLMIQDALRFTFVADHRPSGAFAIDAVWAVAQVVGVLALAVAIENPTTPGIVLVWGLSGVAAGGVGLVLAEVVPRPSRARAWTRTSRAFGPRFVVEFFATQGGWQLTLYVIGGVVGLVAVGALRATQILFGPLHVVNVGARLVAVPEGARRAATPWSTVRWTAVVTGAIAAIAAAWLAVLLVMPDSLGQRLLSDSWAGASAFVLPFGLFMVTQAIVAGAAIGLRILQAPAASMRAAVIGALLTYGGAMLVALSGDVDLVVWTLAIAGSAAALWWWITLALVGRTTRPDVERVLDNAGL